MSAASDTSPNRQWARLLRRVDVPLVIILVIAAVLRIVGSDHGLPFVYNPDELQHFVPKAIGFFETGYNPNYFVNPPAYSYFLHGVFWLTLGGGQNVLETSRDNPESLFLIARIATAALGTATVWLVYVIGRRFFDRWIGLAAAALMAVAFLPVFQAHYALNDVPVMIPVCISLIGSIGVIRTGERRYWILGGVGVGVAMATKYTGGIVAMPLAIAGLQRWRLDGTQVLRNGLLAAASAGLAFFIANPYGVLDTDQSDERGGFIELTLQTNPKPGQLETNGIFYYLWVLTWALGWIPALLSAWGSMRLFLKRRSEAWLLVPTCVAYLIFTGGFHERFFGRWILPIFPLLCVLAAVGAKDVLDRVGSWRSRWRLVLTSALIGALLVQGLAHSIHLGSVLTKKDARNLVFEWLVSNASAQQSIYVEGPRYQWSLEWDEASNIPRSADQLWRLRKVVRLSRYTSSRTVGRQLRRVARLSRYRPSRGVTRVTGDNYGDWLDPKLIDVFEKLGICWVVRDGLTYSRFTATGKANVRAYYEALEQNGRPIFSVSAYDEGEEPIPFNFDWSNDYYPFSFERPGSNITVYELPSDDCRGK